MRGPGTRRGSRCKVLRQLRKGQLRNGTERALGTSQPRGSWTSARVRAPEGPGFPAPWVSMGPEKVQCVLTGSQVTLCERTTDMTAPPAADDPVIQLAPAEHPLTAPAGPQPAATPCLALGLPGGVAGWPRPAAPLDRARLELPQLAGLSRPGPHLRGRGRSPLPGPGPAVWFLCSDGRHKVGADIRPERPLPRAANRLPSQGPPQVLPAATWVRSLSRLPSGILLLTRNLSGSWRESWPSPRAGEGRRPTSSHGLGCPGSGCWPRSPCKATGPVGHL